MRKAILAAGAAMLAMAGAAAAQTPAEPRAQAQAGAAAVIATSAQLAVTSPPNAAPDRAYDDPEAALKQADLDYLVREGRRRIADGDRQPVWTIAVFADEMTANRLSAARTLLENSPGGVSGPMGDMLEPFLLAAEGRADRGVERVDAGADNLPAPLPEVARALVFEAAGRLPEAAAVYAEMAGRLDLTPPGDAEPATMEEFERSLGAARTAHALYRSALVHHRLGRTDDARRLYGLVQEFAPRSIDVDRNLARLAAGEPPTEAPLDAKRALGRWMLFLAEYVTQAEMLTRVLQSEDPALGLDSATGSGLLQLGVLLAGDSDDWRLHAASQLTAARGLEGAERILATMPADSVFAPDADIARAGILLERRQDAEAIAAAERALAHAGDRWSLIASAGDVYRQAYRPRESVAAFNRALELVEKPEDRADILGWRAYAHRFAGDIGAASADARRAFEVDPSVDTRLLYVSILMDDPDGWADGISEARALFAEQPDSVLRLNALGYALIQRPEGLEEGYRLLWRGYAFGQTDYSVVDSLGWAYYLYGRFDDALTLIQRASELSANDPNAEILDHLGDVYWRLNRRDEARATWREALTARPDALRRASLERKASRGLTEAAPRQRELPRVTLPQGPGQRETL
jgi:tetratricopeptide (TPR) repeat protein